MVALPQYDSAALAQLEQQAREILGHCQQKRFSRVEPQVLQRADIFAEQLGESIRRQTFTLKDRHGKEYCLRPELTVPACSMHLASGATVPARLCYSGQVFRVTDQVALTYHEPAFRAAEREVQVQQSISQTLHTGAELIGLPDDEQADNEILELAINCLRATGLRAFSIFLNDRSLFRSMVDDLGFAPKWRDRILRHGEAPDYLKNLVEGERAPEAADTPSFDRTVQSAVLANADSTDMIPAGGRSVADVLERLARISAPGTPDGAALKRLQRLIAINEPGLDAIGEIEDIAAVHGAAVRDRAKSIIARIEMLAELGLDAGRCTYNASMTGDMGYYTGLVFEIWSRSAVGEVMVASGGRYDTLLANLGASREIPAVGFSIYGEPLLSARRATGAL